MESKVDKLDSDKLVPVPVDLSKLNDRVKKEVVKKTEYNELVKKVNAIKTTDTRNLLRKTDYDKKISEIQKNKKTPTGYDHSNRYTTQELNNLTVENFAARLAQAKLATKDDTANLIKKNVLDKLKN